MSQQQATTQPTDWLPCPVDGCGRSRRRAHMMCGGCWRQVPTELQRRVWTAWRTHTSDMTDDHWAAYQHVRDAALRAVTG